MFLPQEFLRKVRDRQPLDRREFAQFVDGVTSGQVTDAQIAAFAMAVYFNELPIEARVALTLAQRDSGDVLDWHSLDLNGPVVDKHSTGGVGDLTSLLLGPMVAACGGYVPMISGRGLGHTGGTLDKLQSIPGYDIAPDIGRFRRVVKEAGIAIIGPTARLAPADKRIYAVRDVTATVESVSMITASILSKKLAAGLHALVMDVKVGSGAFMPTETRAFDLARSIVDVGNGAGMRTTAVLTDMNQPLAPCAGNALEVACAIDYLSGKVRPARLHEVTMTLASRMLLASGLAQHQADAQARLLAALASGRAAERFARMVHALGGPADLLERPRTYLAQAGVIAPVPAPSTGAIARIDARALGMTVVGLGGGRRHVADALDYAVGLCELAELGAPVRQGQPLAVVHAQNDGAAKRAIDEVQRAFTIDETADAPPPAVRALLE